jgi:hypothetical protein
MKYSDIRDSVLAQFACKNGHKVVFYIDGRPGGGKSSVCREIAAELSRIHNIPAERIVEFNPSLRESTDILGLPVMGGDHAKWLPPEEFYRIRKGQGPSILIVEELSDASMDLQNPLCRVLLDRHAGNMALSEELYILASGNRTEDKSGASRLSTKLGNRMRCLHFEENLEDWQRWAIKAGINPILRQFIKWRPSLLSDFDPDRTVNPTPRSWEDVDRIPMTLEPGVFYEHVSGCVGEGAAAEYTGFIRVFNSLPDLNEIIAHPTSAPVPTAPDALFAVVAKLISMATPKNFDKLFGYIARLSPEFQVKACRECADANPQIRSCKSWVKFALANQDLLMGQV